jgi:hypothetical protein
MKTGDIVYAKGLYNPLKITKIDGEYVHVLVLDGRDRDKLRMRKERLLSALPEDEAKKRHSIEREMKAQDKILRRLKEKT